MKNILILLFLTCLFALDVRSQVSECPPDKICLTRAEAIEANKAVGERDALRLEVATHKQAQTDLKAEISRLQSELAKLTGEKNGSDAMVIRLNAIVDLLLKNVKPKKIGLINF